jgi:general stress protein 26
VPITSPAVPADRAQLPSEYGVPADADGMLPWEFVEQRLEAAPNYWVTTVGPGGAPHARPVDGVWVDGALCFGGSPKTRWVRNLQSNAQVSVHLPHDDEVVILEGTAEFVTDAGHPVATPSGRASRAKYPQYYGGGEDPPPFRPFWMLRPSVVYAWSLSGFPGNVTRWYLG